MIGRIVIAEKYKAIRQYAIDIMTVGIAGKLEPDTLPFRQSHRHLYWSQPEKEGPAFSHGPGILVSQCEKLSNLRQCQQEICFK